jgi:hypothetical protein
VNELWKGRDDFGNKKARMEAMGTLTKMIRAWLDEFYPDMPEIERSRMAEAMDVSLIELKKEESMKAFYEINNVIRMSFIEVSDATCGALSTVFQRSHLLSNFRCNI